MADDEARHLGWCLQRLEELGHDYGDMPAHDLLWQGAEASKAHVATRMVVIPMVQEARGLDAGPRLAEKLGSLGDAKSAAIVRRIAEEEKAHVAVGVVWFRYLCAALGLADPGAEFVRQAEAHCAHSVKGPFNDAARQEVGLERGWYAAVGTGGPPEGAAAPELMAGAGDLEHLQR